VQRRRVLSDNRRNESYRDDVEHFSCPFARFACDQSCKLRQVATSSKSFFSILPVPASRIDSPVGLP
jgi:hypothetical protein